MTKPGNIDPKGNHSPFTDIISPFTDVIRDILKTSHSDSLATGNSNASSVAGIRVCQKARRRLQRAVGKVAKRASQGQRGVIRVPIAEFLYQSLSKNQDLRTYAQSLVETELGICSDDWSYVSETGTSPYYLVFTIR